MRIAEYPYGNITKTLKAAVKWLNSNKKKLKNKEDYFDFPDYWNMPKKISSRLNGDEVDWLQAETYNWWNSNGQ